MDRPQGRWEQDRGVTGGKSFSEIVVDSFLNSSIMNRDAMNSTFATTGGIRHAAGVIVTCSAERGTVAADAAAVGDSVSLEGWDG